jgi:hypothetical protein
MNLKRIPPVVWLLVIAVGVYLFYRKYKASASVSAAAGTGSQFPTETPVMVTGSVPSNGYLPGMPLWNIQGVYNPPPVSTSTGSSS